MNPFVSLFPQAHASVLGDIAQTLLGTNSSLPQPAQTGFAFSGTDIPGYMGNIITEAILTIGILAVISITYGAIRLILSDGDEGKAKKAKHIVAYSGIAVIVSIVAYTLVDIVNNLSL